MVYDYAGKANLGGLFRSKKKIGGNHEFFKDKYTVN